MEIGRVSAEIGGVSVEIGRVSVGDRQGQCGRDRQG